MKKNFLKLLAFSLLISATANARGLGIGGSFNHLSNGILLSYDLPLNGRWDFDAGIRVMVNTLSLNKNKQNNYFYQCGYAMDFPEYFGLNLRISRKLIAYRFIRLDIMSNLLITRNSLISHFNNLPDWGPTGWTLRSDTYYTEPAFAGELTIGLKIRVALSPKISLVGASGVGAILMNYKHQGIVMNTGAKFHTHFIGPSPFVNKERGDYEMVGMDGLPMMYLGLSYQIK